MPPPDVEMPWSVEQAFLVASGRMLDAISETVYGLRRLDDETDVELRARLRQAFLTLYRSGGSFAAIGTFLERADAEISRDRDSTPGAPGATHAGRTVFAYDTIMVTIGGKTYEAPGPALPRRRIKSVWEWLREPGL
jgi:hypothetical protein